MKLNTLLAFALSVLTPGLSAFAQTPLATGPRESPLLLGAAWYPEQWPESRWDADLALMEAAHINFVRVGEFAWSTMEPKEGEYKLDWLEHAVRAAERHHIAVVLGTPSAAPPAWLTEKYPETLRTMVDGRKDGHGNRQQFDWSDPKYRELAREIAEKMAARFGHDPNVIAWQIDNEYADESYGQSTQKQFDDWLHAKYKTLDNLNARWTTSYWSETYQDWNQIPIEEKYGNPGLLLNWKEFVSDTWRSYQKNQVEVIRAHAEPRQKITTNMMGWFDGYDSYTVAQDLDFASWDDYVGQGQLDPASNGAIHDLTRGFLRKNFWVMETQPGFVNWSPLNNALNKGEVRAMAWNDIGHGAQAVEYWQWRSALNGQEQYHGTLVGSDGTPVPLYDEVKQLGDDFAKAAPVLAGTTVESQVAILHDYNSRWAINWQRHNQQFDPTAALVSFYRPLHRLVRSIDVVSDTAPLSGYKLVVAPALNVLTPEAVQNLKAYVRGGGHLVLGQRSGMKDEDNSLYTQRQPGPLTELLGARVEQFYALQKPVPIEGNWGSGEDAIWAEQIGVKSPETQVLMKYGKSNGWLDGQPAAVTRKVGKGSITYIGAALDEATMKTAAKWMIEESGVTAIMTDLPEDVELSIRSGDGKRVYILTNYGAETKTVTLPSAMKDVLAGGTVSTVTLSQYGIAVLEATR
ncbi:beta-galactosidase [Granulicella mallensis]|uniref:Beta-galactosidase n=1 Tax=Granulicella mallensis (strain ATCC BAA-1857 / DSM 23137 / MP5ACTX8) TaxID=682795 RepID=G8P1P2_GRAMM|nr:beta-galactosidase [Granulicella mallensis]AEU35867.1 Beta-galactosidase [Granulicella mallensis MP5ACTX8]